METNAGKMAQRLGSTIMEDFVAYPSRWRLMLLMLMSSAFVAIGLLMARTPGVNFISLAGWFSVVFFGLCGIVCVKRMFDTSEQIRIGSTGVLLKHWSSQMIPWSEIKDVTTWSHKGQKMIVLHLRDAKRFPGRGMAAMFASVNRRLTGGDIWISLTGTDRSYNEAMKVILHFRRLSPLS